MTSTTAHDRPRILVLSMSRIVRDARVLRQVDLLTDFGDVTTVGFGERPAASTDHLQVPDDLSSLPETVPGVLRLALRRHRASENSSPAARFVLANADRIAGPWDLVVANDSRVLDLAAALAGGAPIWADMHEWAPEEQSEIWRWKQFVAPFMVHLCERYLPRAEFVTTVGPGIGELYRQQFGVSPLIMLNAAKFEAIEPSPMEPGRIRLVHSGGAIAGRGIDTLIEAAATLPDLFTFDLYLVPSPRDDDHLRHLEKLAAGHDHITIHPPVKPDELARTLAAYDVGVYCIPWLTNNSKMSFPNKLFDFIQARLAIVVGPGAEMARVVREHGMGEVTAGLAADDIRTTLLGLDQEKVEQYKHATAAAARELSFEEATLPIRERLASLLG